MQFGGQDTAFKVVTATTQQGAAMSHTPMTWTATAFAPWGGTLNFAHVAAVWTAEAGLAGLTSPP